METPEEDRLEAALDVDRTVTYEGQSYTYHPHFQWSTGDFQDDYPVLVVGYQTEAGQRDAEQPINDLLSVEPQTDTGEVDLVEGSRVTDELQATVAVDSGFDANGVPAGVSCRQMAMSLWKQIRFGLDLNTVGPNGESPMLCNIAGSPSGPYRQDDTVRSNFVFGVNYKIRQTRTEDAVESTETTLNID